MAVEAEPSPRLRIDVGYTVRFNIEAEEANFDPADAMLVAAVANETICTLTRDDVVVATAHKLDLVELDPPPR
jgi:hypothetical protein